MRFYGIVEEFREPFAPRLSIANAEARILMLLVAAAYVFTLVTLLIVERKRLNQRKPDFLFLLLIFIAMYVLVPGALLTGIVGLFGSSLSTEVPFFDRVLRDVTVVEAALVFVMSSLFIATLYACWFAFLGARRSAPVAAFNDASMEVRISARRWLTFMLVGLTGMYILLESLGGGLTGYQNLILLRAGDEAIGRTFVTANLFSQTQTFAILAIVGFVLFWHRGSVLGVAAAICCLIAFGLMGASRRAFAIPLLLVYLTFVMQNKRFYLFRFVLPFLAIFVPIVMWGKEALAYFAVSPEFSFDGVYRASSGLAGGLRVASDVGQSVVESWATLLYLDLPLRFGVDHLLALLSRIPDGFIGLDIEFPERIVRISTESFVGREQDIPPGLIGQMWLDFGLLGPIVWGILFAAQIAALQVIYDRVAKTPEITALFVVALFVVAMPINTGSFDFTFSVDVMVLVALMYFIVNVRSIRRPAAGVAAVRLP